MGMIPDEISATCKHCCHYFITHDASFRYGCRALDFKSKRLPCLDVIEASWQICQFFKKKALRPKQFVKS